MKDRFIEVVLWVLSISAAAALFSIITIVPALYMTGETEGAFIVSGVSSLIALGIFGLLWVGNYVIRGQKYEMISIFKMVFGKLPNYFWFVSGVLYIGGISKAVYGGASDGAVWGNGFSEGIGAAVAVLLFGGVGRLYRRNRFFGHVVGTIIVSILVIAVFGSTGANVG